MKIHVLIDIIFVRENPRSSPLLKFHMPINSLHWHITESKLNILKNYTQKHSQSENFIYLEGV